MDAGTGGWTEGAGNVPAIAGELGLVPQRPRLSARRALRVDAGLRQRGASGVGIEVLDLSVSGFRAATHLVLLKGTDVWLRLPGLEPWHARVVWCEGNQVGCQFLRPLHPAVVDMIAARTG